MKTEIKYKEVFMQYGGYMEQNKRQNIRQWHSYKWKYSL